jgi:hypothetical protein
MGKRGVSVNRRKGGGVCIGEGGKWPLSLEDTKMNVKRFAIVLFGMLLFCANQMHGQSSAGKSGTTATTTATTPAGAVPDLSKLNVGTMLQQMETTAEEGNADAPSPLQIVVQFLQLQPSQLPIFGQLLQARQTAVTPLFQGIAQREQQLEALVSSGGNPAQIGVLVLQIHALQQQIVQTQQVFLANLASLLDQGQQQRLAAVAMATQLQPVVPAFQVLQLF